MCEIAQEPDELRRDLFQETAVAMGVHPAIAVLEFPVQKSHLVLAVRIVTGQGRQVAYAELLMPVPTTNLTKALPMVSPGSF